MMQKTIENILCSTKKTSMDFRGNDLYDALCFGFSYIESEDHVVNYIVANGNVMKKILAEVPEAILNPTQQALGELWTAKLLVSNKLNDKRIVFSNERFSAVININTNIDKET
jgi:hypothetical protein